MEKKIAQVVGNSMFPTLRNNDYLWYSIKQQYREGDVVIAISPEGKHIVKRILDIDVKDGTVFLVGDNTEDSKDSRDWGRIPITNIIGRVKLSWQKKQIRVFKKH